MTTSPGVSYVQVTTEKAGQRIDNFLLSYFRGVPRSHVYRLLRAGEVRVNKKRIKPEYRLVTDDLIRIPPVKQSAPTETAAVPENALSKLKAAILYEDAGVLVLNKPAGMAVHGGSGVRFGVIEALRQLFPKQTLELVHRLDRDTSGCLLIAKKTSVLRELHRALREHEVTKIYYVLVKGHWPKRLQQINQPLRKNLLQSGERMVRVSAEGKPALTYFQVQRGFAEATLVTAQLATGRTHQIRVHAAYAQHPIAGDEKYGDKEFNLALRSLGLKRLFLHAYQLRLRLPGQNESQTFTAPLAAELEAVLQCLKDNE